MVRSAVAIATLTGFLALGCQPGKPAEAIRPKAPTGAEALGSNGTPGGASAKACTAVDDYGKPLVIDLKGEERGDFEIAMKEGVAVVTYDCNTLRLVDGCAVKGSYGFMGLSPKEELVRLENGDELKANLPISAGPIGAKIGAEMERGMTLDIAMMMVGKRRTTLRSTTRGDLVEDRAGSCKKATHFVRGATIGAFAMETGTKAKLRTAAELLGIPHLGNIGVSGGSNASKSATSRDGSVEDCKQATPDAPGPPQKCGALLRLELTAIDPGGEAGKAQSEPSEKKARRGGDDEETPACPDGFVFTAGKCSPRALATNGTHRCVGTDAADCLAQCDKGDAPSCSIYGALIGSGRAGQPDPTRAAGYFKKACDAGWDKGCGSLGALQLFGDGVPKDSERGLAAVEKACTGGSSPMCELAGIQLAIGKVVPRDRARAVPLLRRGCDGGLASSCAFLGDYQMRGIGMPKDEVKGAQLVRRACDAAEPFACIVWADAALTGRGMAKDEVSAAAAYRKVCDQGKPMIMAEGCGQLALLTAQGRGVARDEARAHELFGKACAAQSLWCQAEKTGVAPALGGAPPKEEEAAAPAADSNGAATPASGSGAGASKTPRPTPKKKPKKR